MLNAAIEPISLSTDADGVIRVAGTRVTLDTLIDTFLLELSRNSANTNLINQIRVGPGLERASCRVTPKSLLPRHAYPRH
ncbi:MAG: hypothetical protein JF614_19675 [Acidobacteria bacterium]|jgi:hypothetical protein|nr:hypothetical protein [Acidobacteriota bacterium]